MEIVGHDGVEMTMNVYSHVSLDAQREALGRLNDALTEWGCRQPLPSESPSASESGE